MSQSNGNAPKFGTRKNVKMIGRTDVAGGGQVVVENGYAFVGHMDPPHGTSILDVKDPKHPKIVAEIEIPQGVHSHKVRVSGDIMLVNLERYREQREAADRTQSLRHCQPGEAQRDRFFSNQRRRASFHF